MLEKSRERSIHARLFSYQLYKSAIAEYEADALQQNAKGITLTGGVQTSYMSNPTMRGGIMLADPPEEIRIKYEWVSAIDEAWEECRQIEQEEKRVGKGLAYVMEKNFCLTGRLRQKSRNAVERLRICKDCGIAERTFYLWLDRIASIVMYYATRRGLL